MPHNMVMSGWSVNLITLFLERLRPANAVNLVPSALTFNSTLKCLSIGTPNLINFPFVSNGKLMIFRCPNIQAHYNEATCVLPKFWDT